MMASFVDLNTIAQTTIPWKPSFGLATAIVITAFQLTLLGLLTTASLCRSLKHPQMRVNVRLLVTMKLLNLYLMHPLASWIIPHYINPSSATDKLRAVQSLGLISLIIGFVLAFFSLSHLRNNYPSACTLNTPILKAELLAYTGINLFQVTRQLLLGQGNQFILTIVEIIGVTLMGFTILLIFRYGIFWNQEISETYLSWICRLLCLRVLMLVGAQLSSDLQGKFLPYFTLIALELTARACANLYWKSVAWRAVNSKSDSDMSYNRYLTLFLLDNLQRSCKIQKPTEP